MKTEAQILGEAIVKDRLKSGKSQEDVAKEVGVSQQAFSGWEAGASMPRHARLSLLASVFGENSATVAAIKELFPKNWNNRLSEVFGHPSIATVLKMTADEHAAFAEKQRRQLNARADRVDSRGFLEPQDREHHRRQDSMPDYELKEELTVILPSGGSRNNLPGARGEHEAMSVQEVREALSRAADDVRFARQALDRTAEQIERAMGKLTKY